MTRERFRVPIRDESGVAWSIAEVKKVASDLGFEEHIQMMIATAVSELANNIIKYAGRGEIVIKKIARRNRMGIEIVAQDRGPGITNVKEALADHFSSSGTLGLGLPGVQRMMDEFDIQSHPGQGTTVIIRKWC